MHKKAKTFRMFRTFLGTGHLLRTDIKESQAEINVIGNEEIRTHKDYQVENYNRK